MPIFFAAHVVIEQRVIRERMDPYSSVAAAGLDRALVLIEGRVGTERSMAAQRSDTQRHRPWRPVLYGVHVNEAASCDAASRFPGRTAYVYRWDRAARRGVLSPLTCP